MTTDLLDADAISRGGPYVLAVVLIFCLGALGWLFKVVIPQLLNTYRDDIAKLNEKHDVEKAAQADRFSTSIAEQRAEFVQTLKETREEFRAALKEITVSIGGRLEKLEGVISRHDRGA